MLRCLYWKIVINFEKGGCMLEDNVNKKYLCSDWIVFLYCNDKFGYRIKKRLKDLVFSLKEILISMFVVVSGLCFKNFCFGLYVGKWLVRKSS